MVEGCTGKRLQVDDIVQDYLTIVDMIMMIEAIIYMTMLDNVMGYSELLIDNDWRVNYDGC